MLDVNDLDQLGDLTVSVALSEHRLDAIANAIGLTSGKVARALEAVHGKTLIRNALAEHWPVEVDDEEWEHIGSETAAFALSNGMDREIAWIVGLSVKKVRSTLEQVHGKTLVRNAFQEHWPDDEADYESEFGPSAIGKWLSTARAEKGYSVPELARLAAVSTATIYFIESGQNQNPRAETLQKLERALGGRTVDPGAKKQVQSEATIEGLGAFTDFNPHDETDLPGLAGVYVFYDISQRPVYVGMSDNMRSRIREHREKFWFKQPIVETGSYVEIGEPSLRRQVETLLIKFLKSNAVLNKQNVSRE